MSYTIQLGGLPEIWPKEIKEVENSFTVETYEEMKSAILKYKLDCCTDRYQVYGGHLIISEGEKDITREVFEEYWFGCTRGISLELSLIKKAWFQKFGGGEEWDDFETHLADVYEVKK